MVTIVGVETLTGLLVHLEFDDGTTEVVDLAPYLDGPIFEPIRNDQEMFRAVCVEDGTITWPNGADIDPNVLYYDLTPAWKELELHPK